MCLTKDAKILHNLPWLGFLLLIVLSISFLLPVLPNDFWWYIRLGSDILINGGIPTTDTYTSTVFGQSVSYPMWLSGVVFYLLMKLGGISAVVLIRGLIISLFYTLLWIICIRKGIAGWLATLLTLICALIGANNWAVRPQIFVYPLFAWTLYLLLNPSKEQTSEEAIEPAKQRFSQYFLLLPIAILWANLHGSLILFFFLTIPYFLFQQRNRKFFFVLVLAFLVTFINPRGPLLWSDTFQLLQSEGNHFSQEWKSPVNSGWQMNLFFVWFLATIPLMVFSRKKLHLYEWIWFLGFSWMAISGVRYVIWFLAIVLIDTSQLLPGLMNLKSEKLVFQYPKMNIIFLAIMVLLPLSLLPGIREKWWSAAPEALANTTPVEAVAWLKENGDLPGELFNDYLFGSYLEYALPERPVWIDTRFHIFSTQQWEDYLSISNGEFGWEKKIAPFSIETFILNPTSQKNLVASLDNSLEYCRVYHDQKAVIFTVCR